MTKTACFQGYLFILSERSKGLRKNNLYKLTLASMS
jgi:hypothetical protein